MHNANENEQLAEQIQKLQEEEYYQKLKERGVNADFKKTELEKLSSLGTGDPMRNTSFETRSTRLTRTGFGNASNAGQAAAPASKA